MEFSNLAPRDRLRDRNRRSDATKAVAQPENGTHATIAEIAAADKINESYVGRMVRPTLMLLRRS